LIDGAGTLEDLFQYCDKNKIQFIDLKSIDLLGRLHHVSLPVSELSVETFSEGVGFDGSSYGFLDVESSDLVQIPDVSTAITDPFRREPTLSFFVNIHSTDTKRTPFRFDVRRICKKAEARLRDLNIAENVLMAPEYEFYLFKNVRFSSAEDSSYYFLDCEEELHHNAYQSVNPFDKYDEFRDEATQLMKSLGIGIRYHHHEGGRKAQQEIEATFNSLLVTADQCMLIRYLLYNLAERHTLRLTFMPKPVYGDAGSGWHVHQFLTREGGSIFWDQNGYASLSKIGLYYVGGLLKHARSLCAFTNPSTNSYKRLVPGFEAPVSMSFGPSDRSAAVRMPSYVCHQQKARIEYRVPDGTANPYLALSAMLMAGLDGIVTQQDPTAQASDSHVQVAAEYADKAKAGLPRNLDEALDALEEDHDYLINGDVFDEALIQKWISLKRKESSSIAARPHPFEFHMYFEV